MLLRFFRSTSAPMIIFIPFLGILLWFHSFLQVPASTFFFDKAQMPLYKFVTDILAPLPLVATLLSLSLVILEGFLLVRLNTQFIFINNRSYLPALFFIILTAAFPDLQRINPTIFSGFFLLLALQKIFESYGTQKLAYDYFIAGFYISVGALFYPFMVFFMMIVWISLSVLKPFNWREWLFTLIGFILPIYFISAYYYIIYNKPFRLLEDVRAVFQFHYSAESYSVPILIFLGLILFIIVLASQFIIRIFPSKKILQRKAYTIFLWLFVNTLMIFALISKASMELIFLGAIPVSYLLAHYFALIKSTFWGNVFLVSILMALLLIQNW